MSNPASSDVPKDVPEDELFFSQEDEEVQVDPADDAGQSWKILIVDDDVEVHEVTRLALSDFRFEEKPLSFISAYSMQGAKQLIQAHPDIAIIFLDVVMETEDAGLQIVQYVREELDNLTVRIILRTGQPGQAPETVIAANYGIDDYKTKTELTAKKLSISVITALRAYSTFTQMRDISRSLKQELIQHQKAEATLRIREMQERDKVEQLERSLHNLQQSQNLQQSESKEPIETLGQLATEITQQIRNSPSTIATMSILTRIARTVLRITDEHSAKLGLSQSKLSILMYLNNEPDLGASPSALAKHCGVSRAAMTGLLDALEQENYVERDSHPSDRRALMIKLTSKGKHFFDWVTPNSPYDISEVLETLDEGDRQEFAKLATQILKMLDC
jgi:DNA-binding MarR family transcriptional regulator/CheY-like chemotaxis protein